MSLAFVRMTWVRAIPLTTMLLWGKNAPEPHFPTNPVCRRRTTRSSRSGGEAPSSQAFSNLRALPPSCLVHRPREHLAHVERVVQVCASGLALTICLAVDQQ